MYSRILVPLDGSATAEKVLPYVRFFAAKLSLPVELFAVVDTAEIAGGLGAEKARFLDSLTTDATEHCRGYLQKVASTLSDIGARSTVAKGRAAEAIVEQGATDKTMLIAMATHGRSGLNRFLLGSVAEKVLRGTANPLLLVRSTEAIAAEATATVKSIIVPLDGSEVAESALSAVVEIAEKLDLEVELLRAYHIPYNVYAGDEGVYAINYDELIAGIRDEAAGYLDKKAAELRSAGLKRVSAVSKEGFAADEIIAHARSAPQSLIAMSSHGRSGVKRWVLGSVAETVVRHAGGPVLITRPA